MCVCVLLVLCRYPVRTFVGMAFGKQYNSDRRFVRHYLQIEQTLAGYVWSLACIWPQLAIKGKQMKGSQVFGPQATNSERNTWSASLSSTVPTAVNDRQQMLLERYSTMVSLFATHSDSNFGLVRCLLCFCLVFSGKFCDNTMKETHHYSTSYDLS